MNKDALKKSILLIAVIIALNVGLAIAKLYVGLSSNSLCIMLDSINSFLDVLTAIASVIALAVVMKSREDAPYGRSEYLASFVVSVVAVVLGGLFLIRSVNRLAMPEPVWFGVESTAIISVAIAVKLGIGVTCHILNKKLNSVAVKAIMLDSFLDVGVTTTSLVSYVVSGYVDYAVDAILGIVLSIVIIIFAVKMVVSSVKTIVVGDKCEDEKEIIENIVGGTDKVREIGKITFHDYGTHQKICVVEVVYDSDSLDEVTDISLSLTNKIFEQTGIKAQILPLSCKGEKYE